jgi:hypothetical protein
MKRLTRRSVALRDLPDRRAAQHFPHRLVAILRQRLLIRPPRPSPPPGTGAWPVPLVGVASQAVLTSGCAGRLGVNARMKASRSFRWPVSWTRPHLAACISSW